MSDVEPSRLAVMTWASEWDKSAKHWNDGGNYCRGLAAVIRFALEARDALEAIAESTDEHETAHAEALGMLKSCPWYELDEKTPSTTS